jgi:predicted permease
MVLAVLPDSGLYQAVLFLHILTAVVGFGSTFVWPMLSAKARATGDPGFMLRMSEIVDEAGHVLTSPFIWASGAFGLLLVVFGATNDPAFIEFSDLWVTIAMTLYLVALGVSLGLHSPNLKRMLALQREMAAAGPPQGGPPPQLAELQDRGKKAAMFGGILHLLFVLILLDMVVKPL